MTELETIQRAKMYMDKLAIGINPLNDIAVPETDLINNVRISRCFSFISGILQRVIENNGVSAVIDSNAPTQLPVKVSATRPFSISVQRKDQFAFSEQPISITEITKRLNALAEDPTMKRLSYTRITDWLAKAGMIADTTVPSLKHIKQPTPEGIKLGITFQGAQQRIVYNTQAQHFILDNLDAFTESKNPNIELQGTPWIQAHDDCLKDLYQKGVPLSEIAVTLKRNTGAIRSRLKKLGLIEN